MAVPNGSAEVLEIAIPVSKPDAFVTNGKSRLVVQVLNFAPFTAVLVVATKFGKLVEPVGAKATRAVTAPLVAVTVFGLERNTTGREN